MNSVRDQLDAEKGALKVQVLTLDPKGNPHATGTVIKDRSGSYYRVAGSGQLQRVFTRPHSERGMVTVVTVKRMTRAEKKAAKRRRHQTTN